MTHPEGRRALPPLPGLIAGTLVAGGVVLWMFVSKGLLIVAGLGAFGPGILRELGVLEDHDEFQRQAAHRAGYHAYLVGGLVAVCVVAVLEWSGTAGEEGAEWIRFIVTVLWLTWMFSALLAYWGAPRTASLLLRTVGSFWALFVIADLIGDFRLPQSAQDVWMGLLGLGMGVLFVAPFFLFAWTVHRWPRPTGIALLGVAALLLVVLGGPGGLGWSTALLTRTLLAGPLLASGLALLFETAPSSASAGDREHAV